MTVQRNFPEYSQYEIPDNQTILHSRSIFDQKNHINFFSFGLI